MAPLLRAQGACATHGRSGWKLGWWEMDGRTLRFGPPNRKPTVNARLAGILGIAVSQRKFLVTSKRVLIITYLPGRSSDSRRCWFLTADVGLWQTELAARVPRQRFVIDVPVEVHVESDEVVVLADLPTESRDDPPEVRIAPDRYGLLLATGTGTERLVGLPVPVSDSPVVEVGPTGTMVVRLRRITSLAGAVGDE
ncbi:MAG: hypothetical protein U0990_03500 [Candidatus Nanopelagicales bacterium]|nr:hypothetical protein [Candidatus Nanopelagicales bacterium]MDZ4249139.1 hypothetical protein [Candidatus Nanopelagicales bacterium]MDZ7578949.1 hypothetical protein [Candidatus Nanopelagicales bacterium]